MLKTSPEKPFLNWREKTREVLCVREDLVGATCAMPLKQVSFEGEGRSEFGLTAPALEEQV